MNRIAFKIKNMAKDKKSFVAYTDWNKTFEKLSDDEAGKLVKMMFAYVNDENPDAPDRITELLFEPFKNQLKRDLKSYEKTLEEKSRKGRMGNLKRWNADLYAKVTNELMDLEEAEEIAKHRHSDKLIATAIKTSQKIADTEIEYDIVIDNETDILLEKETKEIKENSDFEIPEVEILKHPELEIKKEKSSAKKEKFRIPNVAEVQEYCNERQNGISAYSFVNFYQSKGWRVGNQPMKDWKAAIRTWEQKNKENGKSNSNNTVNGNNSSGKNGGKVDGTSEILSGNVRYFEST